MTLWSAVIVLSVVILVHVWAEVQLLRTTRLYCIWTPTIPCRLRSEILFVLIISLRFVTFANTCNILYYFFTADSVRVDVLLTLPASLLTIVVFGIGHFLWRWRNTPNGKAKETDND